MVRDEAQMWLDLLVFIGIIAAIYYLKTQAGIESLSPVDAVQAFQSFGG